MAKANRCWRAAMSNLFPLASTSLHNSNNHFGDKEKQAPQFSFKTRNLAGDFLIVESAAWLLMGFHP